MDVNSPQTAPVSVAETAASGKLQVTVEKPIPFTFDLGNLLAEDLNPVPRDPAKYVMEEITLKNTTRDAAQALVNQILSTCELKRTSDGVSVVLPPCTTILPREKRVPDAKAKTTWERFAEKKGIKKKEREGKMVFDEEKGDWVPKWGYKGKNKDGDSEWLVEVDQKKERETGEAGDKRKENRKERRERVRRNERKQRQNERKAKKIGSTD
ncbi:ribosomal biogenesis regulatory protein [Polyplosphaeria fusca]|uniref:Ribosome biogenesis regulatory protein n=1 Tax=Polyplosphaeria fusca TaxID=682080 RepID=A0A9P4R7K8_9PLEO|nr:ribosomal biogenesis regulatory protein [Polyplosphaeria fusca]